MKKLILLFAALISSAVLFSQNVGIDQTNPANKLDVNGGLSVGSTYSGTFTSPTNGAIIEDSVGIGTEKPEAKLDVAGTLRAGSMGIGTLPTPFKGGVLTAIDTFNSFSYGVIYGEFEGTLNSFNNKAGVYGINITDPDYGIGVSGEGGWKGVDGVVPANGGGDYIGVRGFVFNQNGHGTAVNCGMFGSAQGDSSNNYGVYGFSNGFGGVNYAGYFAGDLAYTGTLIPPSDMRLKKDVSPLQNSLKKVLALQPKNYHFKTEEYKDMNLADGPQIGFIAQEAGAIFPQLMHENVFNKPSGDRKETTDPVEYVGFDYMSLIPVLTGAIQEQQELIDTQKTEIETLKTQLESVVSALQKAGIELK